MKAEGAWEKDGKSAVCIWEKGGKAKKGGLAGSKPGELSSPGTGSSPCFSLCSRAMAIAYGTYSLAYALVVSLFAVVSFVLGLQYTAHLTLAQAFLEGHNGLPWAGLLGVVHPGYPTHMGHSF